MNTMETIYARRSVKQFDPEHTMTKEEINTLFEATIQSPTSFNIQNWRFVIITDPELRLKVQEAAMGQTQVSEASLAVLITADIKAWEKSPERYWKETPEAARGRILGLIDSFYRPHEQLQRDEAIRSVGLAAQTLMLAAKAMDYDSCPMIGFDAEKVAELIQLPEDHLIGMMVVIGKRAKDPWPKPGQLPLSELLIENQF